MLTTLPGVGEFTALVMLAEIGDITRFGSARKLASWAGLTPTVRGPGPDRPARAHPGQGSAWPRWVLNQTAQTARRSPQFAAAHAAIAQRRGKKIATIAIARKLLTRAWHLLAEMQATDAGAAPDGCWLDHCASRAPGTRPLQARPQPTPSPPMISCRLPPVGVKLVRPRRCAAAGAPA